VADGVINIHGAELDAREVDYTDLIARSVAVNAGIWAQQLNVTTGTNTADTAPPAFALDVAALGGMYAERIVLVGTEHGVGVRNAGHLGAPAGQLMMTADGKLQNTGTLQAGHTDIQVAGLNNRGVMDGVNTHIRRTRWITSAAAVFMAITWPLLLIVSLTAKKTINPPLSPRASVWILVRDLFTTVSNH